MATFEFKKKISDIEEPKLLETDWYRLCVSEEPKVRPNEALRDMVGEEASSKKMEAACAKNEKAGFTLFINVLTQHPDVEFAGRRLTVMLPYPSNADMDRFDRNGQRVYDAKMDRIVGLCEAAQGELGEDTAALAPGAIFQGYVKSRRKRGVEQLENYIDIFAGFKSAEEDTGIDNGFDGSPETPFDE